MSHRFFRKTARSLSEFLILSIIAERQETHPYEIHKILREQILDEIKSPVVQRSELIKVGRKILDYYRNRTETKKSDLKKGVKDVKNPLIRLFSKNFLKEAEKNSELINLLEDLIQEAEEIQEYKLEDLTIWDSKAAIYQVLKDLEKNELIKITRRELHQGRSRKLYSITEHGRIEALKMLIIFGKLNQIFISQALVFQKNFNELFHKHNILLLKIVEFLFSGKSILELIKNLADEIPESFREIERIFPLLDNETLLISLLLEDFISIDSLNLEILPSNQQELFKFLLSRRLKKYREKINKLIDKFKR
ncbi:MAG: hypothetical protein GF383_12355 [Candidatus Lokiarchaeota archaeon]|nr:hypothetical protein [Candidatus Lokiarchaeota archaeon]MBD3341792.1 hypothetical protein [Candidatus Lokiarchaeota archaeon]